MNLWGSLPNHENRNVYDQTPPQGLSEVRRAGVFLNCFVTDPLPLIAFDVTESLLKNPGFYLGTGIIRSRNFFCFFLNFSM